MEEQKKEFTGVWIPKYIIEDKDLTMTQMIIYSEICCYEFCVKSNARLGERYGLKSNTISLAVRKLIQKGYVESLGVEKGRYRKLRALQNISQKQDNNKIKRRVSKFINSDPEKSQNIDNIEEKSNDNYYKLVKLFRKIDAHYDETKNFRENIIFTERVFQLHTFEEIEQFVNAVIFYNKMEFVPNRNKIYSIKSLFTNWQKVVDTYDQEKTRGKIEAHRNKQGFTFG